MITGKEKKVWVGSDVKDFFLLSGIPNSVIGREEAEGRGGKR